MEKFHIADVPKTDRITHLVDKLYAKMPVTAFCVGKKAVIGNPGRFV